MADARAGDLLASVTGSPWLTVFVVLIAASTLLGAMGRGTDERDERRRFSGAQRTVILTRAGHRCEHHSWLFGRCGETNRLHADHIHPHSRGGATAVENGQALCRRHNKQKAAGVPSNRELARLVRRRQAYFPAGTDPAVVRRRQIEVS